MSPHCLFSDPVRDSCAVECSLTGPAPPWGLTGPAPPLPLFLISSLTVQTCFLFFQIYFYPMCTCVYLCEQIPCLGGCVEARCPEAEVSGSCELPDELVQSFSPLQERQELSTAELLSSLLPFRFKTESIWHKLTLNFFIAHTGLEHLLLPQPLPFLFISLSSAKDRHIGHTQYKTDTNVNLSSDSHPPWN